jgi:hypothetical protein
VDGLTYKIIYLEGEIMSKTRKELFETVQALRENEFILPAESKVFKQVIIKASEEDFDSIEDQLLEAAESSSKVMEEIGKLAEVIYPTFSTQEEAVAFAKENANFTALESAGFEVYGIRAKNYDDDGRYAGKSDAFHIIVKVNFEGSEYGFGFNLATKSVSYTIDGDGPYYDNMKSQLSEYDTAIKLIKFVIQYVMGIM